MPLDVDRIAGALVDITRTMLAKELEPLRSANADLMTRNEALVSRVTQLEARDVVAELKPSLDGIRASVEALPPPPDLSAFVTREYVAEAVSAAVAAIDAPTLPDVPELVDAAVRAAVEALPAIPAPVEPEPVDLSGFATKEDVASAVAAIVIPEPIPGRDGAGIAEAKMNADGELILKATTGETWNVGKVRGADGLGFEDMSVEWDGERELSLSFSRDGRTEVTRMTIPAIVYRGVWKQGPHQAGDAVTWAGSLFIARRDTTDKPETSDAWTLAAKRGRDGKPAR